MKLNNFKLVPVYKNQLDGSIQLGPSIHNHSWEFLGYLLKPKDDLIEKDYKAK